MGNEAVHCATHFSHRSQHWQALVFSAPLVFHTQHNQVGYKNASVGKKKEKFLSSRPHNIQLPDNPMSGIKWSHL